MSTVAHNKTNKPKKVFIGMSGGVDSSVSAALLQEQGYDVTGVFIKVWHPDFLPCDWRKDRLDAMRVCAHLGIPFKTIDLGEEYKRDVVDYMIGEYKAGRTPNPDVMCNRYIKFGGFWKWAKEQGAHYIATGHYAQTDGKQLLISPDASKDQTYFVHMLTPDDLSHILFPIGGYHKTEVRELAKKFNLPTASKKDSQGLCFVGKVDMKDFLSKFIETSPGNVLNEDGEVIGTHDGALLYTIGERHGFTITTKTDHDVPQYIIKKDLETNALTVAPHKNEASNNQSAHTGSVAHLSHVNWISKPDFAQKCMASVRYHQKPQLCSLTETKNAHGTTLEVHFDQPQTLAVGQSVVFYTDTACLGGGVIDAVTV